VTENGSFKDYWFTQGGSSAERMAKTMDYSLWRSHATRIIGFLLCTILSPASAGG
jgi:hypothetical protein